MRVNCKADSPSAGEQHHRRGVASNTGQCKPACTITAAAGTPTGLQTLPAFTGTGAAFLTLERQPMGKHHTQLHCQLFAMGMAAVPQAMPHTTGRQLSQLAGELHPPGKAAAPTAGPLLEATPYPRFRAALGAGRHRPAAGTTGTPVTTGEAAQPALWHPQPARANAARARKRSPKMEGCGWPCAAAPQWHQLLLVLHRKGFLTGLNSRAQRASPHAAEVPCVLTSVAARPPAQTDADTKPSWLLCLGTVANPQKSLLCRSLAPWK